jgi:ankyrin repeat protein
MSSQSNQVVTEHNMMSMRKGTSRIHRAASNGDVPLLARLVRDQTAHVDVDMLDVFRLTPLQYAVLKGHAKTVDLLLAAGANVNLVRCGSTALIVAVQRSNMEITARLLGQGADPNIGGAKDIRPLHVAAHEGNAEMVRLLLKHGAMKCAQTKSGETPRDFAVAEGHAVIAMGILSE